MRHIVITGASGFVGTHLADAFIQDGDKVTGIGTSSRHPVISETDFFQWVQADTTQSGPWQETLNDADLVINLAGRNIFKIWTQKYKQAIYDSRVLTTRNIVQVLENPDTVFLSTSAVGIYGDGKDTVLAEDHSAGDGFLSTVCVDWEKEAVKARDKKIRTCIMRFGVVLGDKGALEKMVPAFKFFMGGPLGSGAQWFPWIHIRDIIGGVNFLFSDPEADGPFNFAAPHPVRQKEFAASLGRALGRPAFVPAPAFMVKLVMGDLGKAFLESQRAIPERLSESGYEFRFPQVEDALRDILGK